MKPMTSKITHLYQSGFTVETINHFLIFDYVIPGNPNDFKDALIDLNMLTSKRNIYIFVSHHHADHFMPSILEWQNDLPEIQYILSHDVPIDSGKNIHKIQPYDHLKVNEVTIKSFSSTDEGVSFLVYADHLSFFHAGDLNWWHWKDSTPAQQSKEEEDFKKEVGLLQNEKIDVAFIPVDPRLEEAYYWAGKYFFEKVKPSLLVPMHFGGHFETTHQFSGKMNVPEKTIAVLDKFGDQIHFNK